MRIDGENVRKGEKYIKRHKKWGTERKVRANKLGETKHRRDRIKKRVEKNCRLQYYPSERQEGERESER